MKCAHPDCARDGARVYRGGHSPGRPREGTGGGLLYCGAHYEQLRRGTPLREVRPRGISPRAQAVEDCAAIAEFHGHAELAALLRRLEK